MLKESTNYGVTWSGAVVIDSTNVTSASVTSNSQFDSTRSSARYDTNGNLCLVYGVDSADLALAETRAAHRRIYNGQWTSGTLFSSTYTGDQARCITSNDRLGTNRYRLLYSVPGDGATSNTEVCYANLNVLTMITDTVTTIATYSPYQMIACDEAELATDNGASYRLFISALDWNGSSSGIHTIASDDAGASWTTSTLAADGITGSIDYDRRSQFIASYADASTTDTDIVCTTQSLSWLSGSSYHVDSKAVPTSDFAGQTSSTSWTDTYHIVDCDETLEFRDRWYKVVIPASRTVTMSVSSSNAAFHVMLYSVLCNSPRMQSTDEEICELTSSGNSKQFTLEAPAGEEVEYYVLVQTETTAAVFDIVGVWD